SIHPIEEREGRFERIAGGLVVASPLADPGLPAEAAQAELDREVGLGEDPVEALLRLIELPSSLLRVAQRFQYADASPAIRRVRYGLRVDLRCRVDAPGLEHLASGALRGLHALCVQAGLQEVMRRLTELVARSKEPEPDALVRGRHCS